MVNGAITDFFDIVKDVIARIEKEELEEIMTAAEEIFSTFSDDGLVHVFGTGHSHILAEEVFGRAGGFAPVNALLDEGLMLHNGTKYSKLEKMEGYGEVLWNSYDISEKDTIIIISNSGVNAVPVEMALESVKEGTYTIAITSTDYTKFLETSHPSGKKLYQIADLVIDNKGVPGDAALNVDGLPQKVGPTSTISGALILNSIFARTAEIMVQKGEQPPVFKSSNLDGADSRNEKLFEKYKSRVDYF
ncbi:MAG: SIS domain-containing protein [Candidatus Bipolaricaulota bacterium]|nr:SIS domain-containing protein [Candidatus Bipolaricaulota bacterium]MBS3792636.1 SIS domain-containing protein [Candidatus Bipolaricaulota bacterium]